MTGENTEYSLWKKTLGSGIRNQSLLNLMWVELKLYEQYDNDKKTKKKIFTIRFHTYLSDKKRLKDIQSLLNCSERTARDYWKTLMYSEIPNKPKLELHQRNIMANFMDKE